MYKNWHLKFQEIRIKYRWEAMDKENKEIRRLENLKEKYIPEVLDNGDTLDSYWQEADICFSNKETNGHILKGKELNFCLRDIL